MTTLSRDTIEWGIEHLSRHFDTDIFPKSFEFMAISHCRDDVINNLSRVDITEWQTRPFRRCLVPKQRYGFRIATQLDPMDILFYICLILEAGEEIESARLPANQNISFSSRFSLDDTNYLLYRTDFGYQEFQSYSSNLSQEHEYVVQTDISDFYPRIYFHRLESALDGAIPNLPNHVSALKKIIKSWNYNVSFGIPVGNNPSRLIAEIVIDDVDRTLLSEGVLFCRYVDDYRIFCDTREIAYRCLSHLARVLYEMHGLTLQAQKTKILPSDEFRQETIESEQRHALDSLSTRFREILARIGIDDPYNVFGYDDLPPEIQDEMDSLNLVDLFRDTIASENYDISMARFLINRLGWLRNQDALDLIVDNVEILHPIFSEVIKYLARLSYDLPEDVRHRVGARLLDLLNGSVVSQLEFHRTLIMGLFAGSNLWGNAERLPGYYLLAQDDWMRRSVILAIGKSSQDFWLRAKKSQCEQMPPWERRAYLYAASCLPNDERYHWYRAIRPRLDSLEKYIVDWAPSSPINK